MRIAEKNNRLALEHIVLRPRGERREWVGRGGEGRGGEGRGEEGVGGEGRERSGRRGEGEGEGEGGEKAALHSTLIDALRTLKSY